MSTHHREATGPQTSRKQKLSWEATPIQATGRGLPGLGIWDYGLISPSDVSSSCSLCHFQMFWRAIRTLLSRKNFYFFFLEEPPRVPRKVFSSVEGFICRSPQEVSYSESHSLATLFFISLLPTYYLSALWVPEMKNPAVFFFLCLHSSHKTLQRQRH